MNFTNPCKKRKKPPMGISILTGNNRGAKALGDFSMVISESQAITHPSQISTKQKMKKNNDVMMSATALIRGENRSYNTSSLTWPW